MDIFLNNQKSSFRCFWKFTLSVSTFLFDLKRKYTMRNWTHKTSLTPPLFIEVPAPSEKVSGRVCVCVRVSTLPLSTILIFDFRIVQTVWYFFFFIFIHHCNANLKIRNIKKKKTNGRMTKSNFIKRCI